MEKSIFNRTSNESTGKEIGANLYNLVLGLVLCWGFLTGVALADPIDYSSELDSTKFGNLKQTEVGNCGEFACGPTAVTNSFQFLEQKYPK